MRGIALSSESRDAKTGKPTSRTCKQCGKQWIFYYRPAMDKIKDGNANLFRLCSECAARNWHAEIVS